MDKKSITYLAGILPALILPLATFIQLQKIVRYRSVKGVSMMTWLLFGIANIGVYLFTEKYVAWQSLVGFLLTAVLNFTIVVLVLVYRKQQAD